ncbi:MAG: sulfurtransferase [Sarcina sp.]
MNNKIQKATVAIVAVIVFFATFFGSAREQVIVEAKKIVTDSNNIDNNYLIGIQSLDNALGAKGLVILDVRNSKEYNEGHIPGAINVSWKQFVDNNANSNDNDSSNDNNINNSNVSTTNNNSNNVSNSNDENTENGNANKQQVANYTTNWTSLINKKTLTKELQNLGISNQSTVVIYGDSNGDDLGVLGKFSWMFRMVGIDSKMLNGGYQNWKAQGFATTTAVPSIQKTNIQIQNFVPVKTIQKSDIEKNISKIKILELVNNVKNQNNVTQVNGQEKNTISNNQANGNGNTANSNNQVNTNGENNNANMNNQGNTNNVQVKTQEQDTQSDPPINGVIQIKLSDMLNPNGTIKPVNQLQTLFSSKGIEKNDIILFYNTDKGNLAFLTLMLNMAGYNNIQSYNANLEQVVNITTQIMQSKQKNQNQASNSNGSQNSSSVGNANNSQNSLNTANVNNNQNTSNTVNTNNSQSGLNIANSNLNNSNNGQSNEGSNNN